MIIENAFGYLPEILTGSNYAAQDYEGGIVTAVSLAVLQELNARNVPNPLSNICVEKLYDNDGFSRGGDENKKRYLRADLHVDLSRIWVGSSGLARFGWRYKNWLEAKYFRKGKISSTTACAHIAADLMRLCALTPPEARRPKQKQYSGPLNDPKTMEFSNLCTGRYFLHVYDSRPEELVGKGSRPWITYLRDPGRQSISFSIADDRAKKEFVGKISEKLKTVRAKIQLTNFCRSQQPSGHGYLCVLSRIDSFSVSMDINGNHCEYAEDDERIGKQSSEAAWKDMRDLIGAYLLLDDKKSKDIDSEPPSEDELQTSSLDTSEEVED